MPKRIEPLVPHQPCDRAAAGRPGVPAATATYWLQNKLGRPCAPGCELQLFRQHHALRAAEVLTAVSPL